MTLIDDANGEIANLAVYNLDNAAEELLPGRKISIVEPLYKIREDGTPGIRVDNPNEIQFDLEAVKASVGETPSAQENEICGKPAFKPETSRNNAPQIPDRRPETYRVVTGQEAVKNKNLGNEFFQEKQYVMAEKHYSMALQDASKCNREERDDEAEGVTIWSLYSNRALVLLKLGKPDLALKDATLSHLCSPLGEKKPMLRCAQALAELGYYAEAKAALAREYDQGLYAKLVQKILPRTPLYVGPARAFKSIGSAIQAAQPESEIFVDPGIYTEPILIVDKPLTLRSIATASGNGVGIDDNSKVEIHTICPFLNALACIGTPGSCHFTVRLVGFRIVCSAPLKSTMHTLLVHNCTAVVRDCTFSSSSGPVLCAEAKSRLIVENCTVRDGGQGGVIVADEATLAIRHSRICNNAASGIELREGGSAVIQDCDIFSNGRQGVVVWMQAGTLRAERTTIHSHRNESGAIVCENESALATFRDCVIFCNQCSGVNIERKGRAEVIDCKIFENEDGVQIQGTGNATVSNCDIYENADNGIFVGFDHRGRASIVGNRLIKNGMEGLKIGPGLGSKLRVAEKKEQYNLGRLFSSRKGTKTRPTSSKWAKRVMKNAKSSDTGDAMSGIEERLFQAKVTEALKILGCDFCERQEAGGEKFSKCSRCKEVFYCSKDCQLKDWNRGHKNICAPKRPKHRSFIDPNKRV